MTITKCTFISICHPLQAAGLAVHYYPDRNFRMCIKNAQAYENITNLSWSALYCLSFPFWLRLAGKGCCWHCTIGLDGELQNRSRSLDWDVVAHAAEHRQKKKGHPYARIWADSLSQMFPFQRRASELIFLVHGLRRLNAVGISCCSESENAPGSKFATWRHMRISDTWSNTMEWSEGSAFLKSIKYQWGGRNSNRRLKPDAKGKQLCFHPEIILKTAWRRDYISHKTMEKQRG